MLSYVTIVPLPDSFRRIPAADFSCDLFPTALIHVSVHEYLPGQRVIDSGDVGHQAL